MDLKDYAPKKIYGEEFCITHSLHECEPGAHLQITWMIPLSARNLIEGGKERVRNLRSTACSTKQIFSIIHEQTARLNDKRVTKEIHLCVKLFLTVDIYEQ